MDDPRSDEGLLDHDRAALEAEIAALVDDGEDTL